MENQETMEMKNVVAANEMSFKGEIEVALAEENFIADIARGAGTTTFSIDKKSVSASKLTLTSLIDDLNNDVKTRFIGAAFGGIVDLLKAIDFDLGKINVEINKFFIEYVTFDEDPSTGEKKESTLKYDILVALSSSDESMIKFGPLKMTKFNVSISNI